MASRDQTPAHEITPPEFLAEHLDEFDADSDRVADVSTDELAEALRLAERQRSTTDYDTMPRCPECLTTELKIKSQSGYTSATSKGDYGCHGCGAHFDEPRAPLAEHPVEHAWKWLLDQQTSRSAYLDTMPMNTPFEWLSNCELTDPAERGSSPLFDHPALDDATLTELAIRLYRPWSDGGPSYRTLADLFPYSRTWIGDRVREWRDGEHRDLVERPGPTVDDESDATALATDGGRRRRWDAYGSD